MTVKTKRGDFLYRRGIITGDDKMTPKAGWIFV
jgi:hypothetical protein